MSVVFIHIPKTAGGTLKSVLARAFALRRRICLGVQPVFRVDGACTARFWGPCRFGVDVAGGRATRARRPIGSALATG